MDLPTCPHCGQSVLDDDVDECPFCGESMSGQPTGEKPAAPKPPPVPVAKESAPLKSETPTSPKRPAKSKPKPAESAPSSDQPFAVDHAAFSNAVPLRPKPSPGRTFKVVCPMCETAGYTSPKAGGREVKCANPKCLVPVFTCPEPPPAPVQAAPADQGGLSTTTLGLISVALLAAVGFGVWFFVLKDDSPTPADPRGGLASQNQNVSPEQKTQPAEPTEAPVQPVPPVRQAPDLTKFRQQAPEKMVAVSQLQAGRWTSRPKPMQVEWTALGFAEIGKLEEAEEQLARMSTFGDDAPHYRVLPWVEIGWQQRAREESPADAVNKALEFSKTPPASLPDSWLQAVSLSALLAATGRADDTAGVLNRNLGRPQDQELWSDLMAVTLDGSFNLENMEPLRPVVTLKDPAAAGVVWQLVFHDAVSEGLDWAKRGSDPQTQTETLTAWGDAVVAHGIASKQPASLDGLDAAIQELPGNWQPLATARAYSRMGQRYAMAGDSTQAQSMLQTAAQALAGLPQREPMAGLDLMAIHAGRFPRRQPVTDQIAIAAFEVARLQSTLNRPEEAWKSVEQGLAALRSETLSKSAADELEAGLKNADSLRSQLQTALSLRSNDEARQAYRTYLKNVNDLIGQAKSRLELQAELLAGAARWNLAEQVAQEMTTGAENGDLYFSTDLPWPVLAELKTQNPEAAKSLEATLKEKKLSKPKGQALLEDSARWMADLNVPKVVDGLVRDRKSLPDPVRRRWILRLATQEVLKGNVDEVLSFLTGLYNADPFLGEDAAELVAGLATRNGHGQTIWNELTQRDWAPSQKLAAYLGFIAGSAPRAEAPAETN